MNILNVEKVSKTFGEKVLLDKVTLGINKGDKVGVIGVNGTGKSTLLKIIAGIEEPDEGNVIKGRNVTVTYLAQSPDHAKDETVLSYVLRGKANASEAKAKEILNKLGIGVFDASMDMLSGGQKKRVALAKALVEPTEVLILDEPTVGLDPKQIIEIRDVIRDLSKDHTIILSSHILSEVSAVCNRVIIINKGRLVAVDTPERLSESLSQNRFRIRVKGDREKIIDAFKADSSFACVEEGDSAEQGTVDLVVEGAEGADPREAAFNNAVKNGFVVLLIKSEKMSLEEVFLQVTENETLPNENIADSAEYKADFTGEEENGATDKKDSEGEGR